MSVPQVDLVGLRGAFVALSLPVLVYLFRRMLPGLFRPRRKLPPSPPGGLPIFGHLLQMPRSNEWLKYLEWSKNLDSDVICYKVLGTHVIVLNSAKAVTELFDGRTAIYSGRPPLLALRNILGFHWVYGLMPYGKRFQQVRKAANQHLHSSYMKEYEQVQTRLTHELLRDIQRAPEQHSDHARKMGGNLILNITYGIHLDDVYMNTAYKAFLGLDLGLSPRGILHDMFPILMKLPEWFPLFQFKKEAKKYSPYVDALPDLPLHEIRKLMAQGNAPPSIALSMFSAGNLSEDTIRTVTGSLYLAGIEFIIALMCNFFIAMIKYPETLKKAQAEIDSVLGNTRLPTFADEAQLTYVNALIKELYRWRNITPQGIPRRLMTDDIYRDYYMPKDSIVIGNTHAILHNPVEFPEPYVFRPERYLDPSTRSPDMIFGYGGRQCPGRYLAKTTTWLVLTSILAVFHVERAVDEQGNYIEPDEVTSTDGHPVSFPAPFKCKIVPRSEAALDLIRATELADD